MDLAQVSFLVRTAGIALKTTGGALITIPDGWIAMSCATGRLDRYPAVLRSFFQVLSATFPQMHFRVQVGPPLYRVTGFDAPPRGWTVIAAPERQSGVAYGGTGVSIGLFVDVYTSTVTYEMCAIAMFSDHMSCNVATSYCLSPLEDGFAFDVSLWRMLIWLDGDSGLFSCFMKYTPEIDAFLESLRATGIQIGDEQNSE